MQKWVYLSPHLDDIAISCGGLIWEQVQAGAVVEAWTICAGDPPSGPFSPYAEALHARWQTKRDAASIRRQEDRRSCQEIGASWHHFSIPDCIYRTDAQGQYLYTSQEALFGDLQPADLLLLEMISHNLAGRLSAKDRLVVPMAIGNHVDHRLTRAAAEVLARPLWYYADYPYAFKRQGEIDELLLLGWKADVFPISEDALRAWVRAVSAHQSQISSFWAGIDELQADLEAYREQMGGERLWQPVLVSN